jgi:hypothetical protein
MQTADAQIVEGIALKHRDEQILGPSYRAHSSSKILGYATGYDGP